MSYGGGIEYRYKVLRAESTGELERALNLLDREGWLVGKYTGGHFIHLAVSGEEIVAVVRVFTEEYRRQLREKRKALNVA